MNVLVIAPHPDDEVLGCGGAIFKHTTCGDRVVAVFLTSGELGLKQFPRKQAWKIREAEAKRAAKILRLSDIRFFRLPDWNSNEQIKRGSRLLAAVLKRERPALIYLPHPNEWHPDHQAALPMLQAAAKRAKFTATELRGYEVWTPISEHHHVKDISREMSRKLRALRAHRSQLREFDYERAVRGLNQYRGVTAARTRFAEVFQSLSLTSDR
jgi:N-acetylglucosamine malate deacetylase 1